MTFSPYDYSFQNSYEQQLRMSSMTFSTSFLGMKRFTPLDQDFERQFNLYVFVSFFFVFIIYHFCSQMYFFFKRDFTGETKIHLAKSSQKPSKTGTDPFVTIWTTNFQLQRWWREKRRIEKCTAGVTIQNLWKIIHLSFHRLSHPRTGT